MLHHGHGHGQLTISIFDMIQSSLQTTPQLTATNTKNIDRQGSVIKLYKRNILPRQNICIYIYIYECFLGHSVFSQITKTQQFPCSIKAFVPLVMFPSPHPNLREALNNQWGRFGITDQNRMESKKCYGFYTVCIDRGCFPLIWGQ